MTGFCASGAVIRRSNFCRVIISCLFAQIGLVVAHEYSTDAGNLPNNPLKT
ncbi:hypothetical protein [Moraxella lacunata]|uniref:hypothetical protein n=1 Tax=Moraxella lacunata TaxID=477 RepID=UPI003EE1CC2C